MKRSLILMATVASACACSRERPHPRAALPAAASVVSPAALPEVRVWGALRTIMHGGQTGPHVTIAEAMTRPHTFGVGALSGLRGEVTIVDGLAWLSHPEDDGTIVVQQGGPPNETATLLVAAGVPDWRSVAISADLAPDDLDERLEALARANGIDVERPFPLLLVGRLREVSWHVLNPRKVAAGSSHEDHLRGAATGTIREGDGLLVGFFSKKHQGIFTHMGQRTHFHVLTSDHLVMGHADRAGVRAGATLKLPGLSK